MKGSKPLRKSISYNTLVITVDYKAVHFYKQRTTNESMHDTCSKSSSAPVRYCYMISLSVAQPFSVAHSVTQKSLFHCHIQFQLVWCSLQSCFVRGCCFLQHTFSISSGHPHGQALLTAAGQPSLTFSAPGSASRQCQLLHRMQVRWMMLRNPSM